METSYRPSLRLFGTGVATAVASAALVTVAPAGTAAAPAPSTVTIQAEGTDIFGKVKSPRRACKAHRTVLLFKVLGGKKGGGDDSLFATDTTELRGGAGVWSTGNLGSTGRFYARVKKNNRCQGDTSRVIRVRNG